MEQAKIERAAEEQRNRDAGNPGDVDFQRMINVYRNDNSHRAGRSHDVTHAGETKICICVRKRPISVKEVKRNDYDSVTCFHPQVVVHDCKLKVDGISKYLDNTPFEFDHTFDEDDTTDDLYSSTVRPLVGFVLGGGRATVFAYGQTGSGKTYTMQGIQGFIVDDLFDALARGGENIQVFVSYFEIYGGRCQDLLNGRQRLNVREDGGGEVVVSDLVELDADTPKALHAIIETGNRNRTTHATESNDESSRSHAICQVALRNSSSGALIGRLSLIDLAGSERGADTKSHNRQRRMEGAEINKSLLALKECIRALDTNSIHVPYRASKLTLVLKDSFTNKKSKTVMIVNLSPAASSADHTINTLRYADRIKSKIISAPKNNVAAAKNGVSPLPVANGGHQAPKDKNIRNKDIQKVLAENITAAPPMPPAAQDKRGVLRHNSRHESKAEYYSEDEDDNEDNTDVDAFHQTVQDLFEEEEDLLNLHMSVIQENAELLTEEGKLLQQIQGENNDIDNYATRLNLILLRKQELITILREKLDHFRHSLKREEVQSKKFSKY
jgi:kinesin family protein 2/24